jgi:hypothetical protein
METLMHSPKKVYLLIGLILFSTLIAQVWASPNPTVTLHGGGITIDLTYPEEAHPEENIWHNATITANTAVTLNNLTMVIKAPVNSNWQTVFTGKDERNIFMQENSSFQWSMGPILLPPNANGTLQCFIFLKTSSVDNISTTIYTTHVSELTFSEMQTLYNEMLANYTLLQTDYETLLNQYDGLLADYNSSVANYTSLLSQHTELQTKYNSQVAAYKSQLNSNEQLSQEYNNLNTNYKAKITELSASQSDYETLNTTKNNLQTSYTTLQNDYNTLNQTNNDLQKQLNDFQEDAKIIDSDLTISQAFMFIALMAIAGLVALIVYLKRKKPEPYMVIRKETVTVENDENPPP